MWRPTVQLIFQDLRCDGAVEEHLRGKVHEEGRGDTAATLQADVLIDFQCCSCGASGVEVAYLPASLGTDTAGKLGTCNMRRRC